MAKIDLNNFKMKCYETKKKHKKSQKLLNKWKKKVDKKTSKGNN